MRRYAGKAVLFFFTFGMLFLLLLLGSCATANEWGLLLPGLLAWGVFQGIAFGLMKIAGL